MGAAQGRFADNLTDVIWRGSDAVVLDGWTLKSTPEDLYGGEVGNSGKWTRRFTPGAILERNQYSQLAE